MKKEAYILPFLFALILCMLTSVKAANLTIEVHQRGENKLDISGDVIGGVELELITPKNGTHKKTTNTSGVAVFSDLLILDSGEAFTLKVHEKGAYLVYKDTDIPGFKKIDTLGASISTFKGNRTLYVIVDDFQTEFSGLSETEKIDPIKRIELYNKYGYKNLLDFNNITNPDDYSNCEADYGCLNVKTSEFNEKNISCFDDTTTMIINGTAVTAYCKDVIEFSLNFSWSIADVYDLGKGNIFRSGEIVSLSDLNPNVKFGKICYAYSDELIKSTSISTDVEEDIGIMFNEAPLTNDGEASTTGWVSEKGTVNGKYYIKYSKFYEQKYIFPAIYSKIGNGKIVNPGDTQSRYLGTGVISRLYQYSNDIMRKNVKFELIYNGTGYSTSDKCYYRVRNTLITSKCEDASCTENFGSNLELEFRIIDTEKPFPGKNGVGRLVGSNWCAEGHFLVDCSNKNSVVTNVMARNNSYNKEKTSNPKYSIKLTPSAIIEIRNYNKGLDNNYDDTDLFCDEEKSDCTNEDNWVYTFLENLEEGNIKGNEINTQLIRN